MHKVIFQAALEAAGDPEDIGAEGTSKKSLLSQRLKNALRSGDIWVKDRQFRDFDDYLVALREVLRNGLSRPCWRKRTANSHGKSVQLLDEQLATVIALRTTSLPDLILRVRAEIAPLGCGGRSDSLT